MKKLLIAGLLCGGCAFADQISGYISDAHCGAKHSSPSAANTKCVVDMCMKGGSDPVLVKDGKVIKFDSASKEKAAAFAGKNVSIDGTMDGDVLKVNNIDESK
jgi:hypothetical protein